jgi:hypothetical protein
MAEREDAPFCKFEDYKRWVLESIEALRREESAAVQE